MDMAHGGRALCLGEVLKVAQQIYRKFKIN